MRKIKSPPKPATAYHGQTKKDRPGVNEKMMRHDEEWTLLIHGWGNMQDDEE